MALTSPSQNTNQTGLFTNKQDNRGIIDSRSLGNILGKGVGSVNPYAGLGTQVGLNALTEYLRSSQGGNVGLARSLFGKSDRSASSIGGGAIGGTLGGLTNILLSKSLEKKPWGQAVGSIGGYGVQSVATPLAEAGARLVAGQAAGNVGSNIVGNLTNPASLGSLGLGVISSLIARNNPEYAGAINSFTSTMSPFLSYLLMPTNPISLPISMVLSVASRLWQDSKERKAEAHARRRSRAAFGNYLDAVTPEAEKLREAQLKMGEGRLRHLKNMGITDPALIQAAYGIDQSGYTVPEKYALFSPTYDPEWSPATEAGRFATRLTLPSGMDTNIRDLSDTTTLRNSLGLYSDYVNAINQGITEGGGDVTPEMMDAIRGYWGGGFTTPADYLHNMRTQQESIRMRNYDPVTGEYTGEGDLYGEPLSFENYQSMENVAGDPMLRRRISNYLAPEYIQKLQDKAYNAKQAQAETLIQPYEDKRQELENIFSSLNTRSLSPYGRQTKELVSNLESVDTRRQELENMAPGIQAQLDALGASGLDVQHDPSVNAYLSSLLQRRRESQRARYSGMVSAHQQSVAERRALRDAITSQMYTSR